MSSKTMNQILKKEKGHFAVNSGLSGLSVGVVGREINSIDYKTSYNKIRLSEKKILTGITGITSKKIAMLDQVHGNIIIHVVNMPSSELAAVGEADGLITPIKGIELVIRSADCVPVFLYDPVNEVLAAAHSGWKGTKLNIAGKCVRDMHYIYGSDPGNIRAFLLPSIGPDSYEVNEDVASHFPESTITKDGKLYVDLWNSIENSLKKAGVKGDNISNPRICNRINHSEFFSHRFGDMGRNLNFAFMK